MAKDNPTSAKRVLWALLALFGVPLLLVLAKCPGSPVAPFLTQHLSLRELPLDVQHRLTHILFVPAGALLVVFVRLTLGLRILGPFRSILLAVAFQATGVIAGLIFLFIATALVTLARSPIKSLRLPYYGRITVLLSGVAALVVVCTLAGLWFDWHALQAIAYFPLVVLCLVGDAFARTVQKEGLRSALWRGGVTAALAALLSGAAALPQLQNLLLNYPELTLMQIGGIVLVSKHFAWRYFAFLNPTAADADEENEFESDGDTETTRKTKSKLPETSAGPASNIGSTAKQLDVDQVQQA